VKILLDAHLRGKKAEEVEAFDHTLPLMGTQKYSFFLLFGPAVGLPSMPQLEVLMVVKEESMEGL